MSSAALTLLPNIDTKGKSGTKPEETMEIEGET